MIKSLGWRGAQRLRPVYSDAFVARTAGRIDQVRHGGILRSAAKRRLVDVNTFAFHRAGGKPLILAAARVVPAFSGQPDGAGGGAVPECRQDVGIFLSDKAYHPVWCQAG